MPAVTSIAGDFVRRVVDSLLRGGCRGRFLCSRCLVKLTRDHLDERYTTGRIAQLMDEVFRAPGLITHAAMSTCAACAGRTMPCLGVPVP